MAAVSYVAELGANGQWLYVSPQVETILGYSIDEWLANSRNWMKFVAPERIVGAFVVGQLTLLLLLIPRFWQRGIAVSYWQQRMMVPVVAVRPIEALPVPIAVVSDGVPVIPAPPLATPQS